MIEELKQVRRWIETNTDTKAPNRKSQLATLDKLIVEQNRPHIAARTHADEAMAAYQPKAGEVLYETTTERAAKVQALIDRGIAENAWTEIDEDYFIGRIAKALHDVPYSEEGFILRLATSVLQSLRTYLSKPRPTSDQSQEIEELREALSYLLEQTVDQDMKYGIGLSEGEEEARQKALALLGRREAI